MVFGVFKSFFLFMVGQSLYCYLFQFEGFLDVCEIGWCYLLDIGVEGCFVGVQEFFRVSCVEKVSIMWVDGESSRICLQEMFLLYFLIQEGKYWFESSLEDSVIRLLLFDIYMGKFIWRSDCFVIILWNEIQMC